MPNIAEENSLLGIVTVILSFTQRMFLSYYEKCFEQVLIPAEMESREFGVMLPDSKMMIRHKTLENPHALQVLLQDLIPSDVYHSIAYYDKPDATEMTQKGWHGADLVFDIDADHIPSECEKTHDEWICVNCGVVGNGTPPIICPSCSHEKFQVNVWPCSKCIDSAKYETIKLLDMLTNDFGFSENEVQIYFSGHRGYHVHVEEPSILDLDAGGRKEIVDYVIGLGLDTEFLERMHKSDGNPANLPGTRRSSHGWEKRAAGGIAGIVVDAGLDDIERFGIDRNLARILLKNKEKIVRDWGTKGFSGCIKGFGVQTLKKLFIAGSVFQSSRIDTVVTTDTHRLIRLAGTLHGKTGLRKTEVSISNIDSFDPFKSAVAFSKGDITVFAESAPEFRIGDEIFGPFDGEKVILPTAAALLLVCKKRARVID